MNDMEPVEAYSRFVLRKLRSDEIASLANSWLSNGTFTETLNQLWCEKEPVMSSVGPLFEKAMIELGVERPDRLEAARTIIRATLKRIIQSKIPPDEGAAFLYWDVYLEISAEWPNEKYAGDCLGLENIFCWLREIWDCRDGSLILYYSDLPRSEAEEKFKQHLIDESRKWLEKTS